MVSLPKKLVQKLRVREEDEALRTLVPQGKRVDFSSNDYLGYAKMGSLGAQALEIMERTQCTANGSTGSRLLTGNHRLYKMLEERICDFHEVESALVFNSGYDANTGFFSAVPQRDDIVFYDALIHASIRDGLKMGNARGLKFQHNDITDLKECIERNRDVRHRGGEIYVVTESVFSMDGDSPDLLTMVSLCERYGAYLVVDEAHAVGVFGKGLVNQLNIQDRVFARIITFGKALGGHGAAILGKRELREYLVNFARSLIYTTGLSPHSVALALGAYEFMEHNHKTHASQLMANIDYFKTKARILGLGPHLIESKSPIQSVVIPGNKKVRGLSRELQREGFDVCPILSPTVPKGGERLRFCLHSYNTEPEIETVLRLVADAIGQLRNKEDDHG